jgi:hypothetical protein
MDAWSSTISTNMKNDLPIPFGSFSIPTDPTDPKRQDAKRKTSLMFARYANMARKHVRCMVYVPNGYERFIPSRWYRAPGAGLSYGAIAGRGNLFNK